MADLFSYVLRYDDGAAPNPFWGLCTLAICKPAIRRVAEVGDWVVGTGSANSPIGDIRGSLVYAMKVTKKISLEQYDTYCQTAMPRKIPKWRNGRFEERMGDCIYEYSLQGEPVLRESVHSEQNRAQDLGGEFVLLSQEFYYFGDRPVPLPDNLIGIIKSNQGHKRIKVISQVRSFEKWVKAFRVNEICGEPQLKREFMSVRDLRARCSHNHSCEDEVDPEETVC